MGMKARGENTKLAGRKAGHEKENTLPGYPIYPENDDIYSQYDEEKDIDPEVISEGKDLLENEKGESRLRKDVDDNFSGRDLDIPGSELDDKLEDIGSEDEENNYYSIGGDDHENLDEDRGE